jgi:hypothetical protein
MIQLTQEEAEYILEQLNHVALQHMRAYNSVDDKLLDAIHDLDVKVNPEDFDFGGPADEVASTPVEKPTTDVDSSEK